MRPATATLHRSRAAVRPDGEHIPVHETAVARLPHTAMDER